MDQTLAQQLMDEFAFATGVTGETPPRRYLWTDAFAVCNFLALRRLTGNDRYLGLATNLVDQVHHVLGRHRPDDRRTGWISGLSAAEGKRHPTAGGLRIGKPLNERSPGEPADPRLEWEQDGQYFHYLTKWMHALCRMSRETSDDRYWRWATELAVVSQRAFTAASNTTGAKRMVWKMSIDLTRPLVSSMGHHDPLDGLVTVLELETVHPEGNKESMTLKPVCDELTAMTDGAHWATDDALGIGGLLEAATRLVQLVCVHRVDRRNLLRTVLFDAIRSLRAFDLAPLSQPAGRRLAFRELGLAIGISGIQQIRPLTETDDELADMCDIVLISQPVAERIRSFWSIEKARQNETWREHQDINSVMLATCHVPEGFLSL